MSWPSIPKTREARHEKRRGNHGHRHSVRPGARFRGRSHRRHGEELAMRSDDFWSWYDGFAAPRLKGRAKTFRAMFEHLDRFDRPVHIVETGCMEEPDNWGGNGCSTILFDCYARHHAGSTVRTVDVAQDKIEQVRDLL